MNIIAITTFLTLLTALTACTTNPNSINISSKKTNNKPIPQITDIDLQYASNEAKQNNKTLMIVYSNDSCSTCKKWLANTLKYQQSNTMLKQFEIKSVSLQKGIEVICPSGIELDNEEFYEAKGIEGDLSIVFHNDIGEVVFTYNEQPNKAELDKLLHYITLKKYQEDIEFEDWINKRS